MKNCKYLSLFIMPLAAISLFGCAQSFEVKPIATEPDIIGERVAQAAETASRALNNISGIEQQRTPLKSVPDYTDAPSNLTKAITVKWSGPIDQIVRTLASHANVSFRIKGSVPPVPLVVSVDAYQQPIIQVLRDIGLQAGHRADLSVDAQHGIIEIRYAPVER
ncbi:MAG: DotD/TraH family lipoprotein [Alphaproteobacteria bacterium]|nr:DotD/TraH family lipoprotein [Alphaproteobacteria bacterium]